MQNINLPVFIEGLILGGAFAYWLVSVILKISNLYGEKSAKFGDVCPDSIRVLEYNDSVSKDYFPKWEDHELASEKEESDSVKK